MPSTNVANNTRDSPLPYEITSSLQDRSDKSFDIDINKNYNQQPDRVRRTEELNHTLGLHAENNTIKTSS